MSKCQHKLLIGTLFVPCTNDANHEYRGKKQLCGRCWFTIMNGIAPFRPKGEE